MNTTKNDSIYKQYPTKRHFNNPCKNGSYIKIDIKNKKKYQTLMYTIQVRQKQLTFHLIDLFLLAVQTYIWEKNNKLLESVIIYYYYHNHLSDQ